MLKIVQILYLGVFLFGVGPHLFAQTSWTAPPSANDLKNPFKEDASATQEGKKIYSQMCALCHGPKGKGKGAAGLSLDPKPSDFLSIKVVDESDGAIFWKMTEGNPPMAAYNTLLTEDQRWKLVNYIRKLEQN